MHSVPVLYYLGTVPLTLTEIRRSFDYLDVNKDGRISVQEVVRGTQIHGLNPTGQEADEMIAEMDISGMSFYKIQSQFSWCSCPTLIAILIS